MCQAQSSMLMEAWRKSKRLERFETENPMVSLQSRLESL
jgi:hypothetical protein